MTNNRTFDTIIVGGSYSGLSAAMTLGRSLRQVLVIDSGVPCNYQTPHSHNFITHDGHTPREIAEAAKKQVEAYDTVHFHSGLAVNGKKANDGFEITTEAGEVFTSRKQLFATGIRDIMPDIRGFSDCWGISVLHCPYCHGYEVRNKKTGLILNGDMALEFAKMINHWTKDLTLFTNAPSTLTSEQTNLLKRHNIQINEKEIEAFSHKNGYVQTMHFKDGSECPMTTLYTRADFIQHCPIPEQLDCTLNDKGLIEVDMLQKTSVDGIYASGDNSSFGRAVSLSVASRAMAGMALNKEMIEEDF
ncbi:MAG: NAD(P)/FAD-dependent oxidoreductase [Cyclobacteriaceae bacterium]